MQSKAKTTRRNRKAKPETETPINLPAVANIEIERIDSAQIELLPPETETPNPETENGEQSKAEKLNSARKTAAAIFAQLSESVSIPIKPVAGFKLNRDLQPHPNGRNPSIRQAAAITVAIAASGGTIANGVSFPREFPLRGEQFAIENGCASDFLKSELATYCRETETFTVSNASEIRAQLGKKLSGFNL